jgi:hypothetical protein
MKRPATRAVAVLLAVGLLACGGGETADQQRSQGQPQPGGQQQQQQVDVSDEELQAFAEATRKLQDVAEQAQGDMKEAGDQQARQQVRDDFLERQAEIVQEVGLDTARYTEIRQAVERDSDLRQRLLEIQQQSQQ